MMNGNLPDGWEWVYLQDTCKIQTGKKDVDEGNPNGDYPFFTCAAIPTKSDHYSFDGESILLPGNGANVGMSIFYRGKFEAYQRTYVLNQFSANAKYILYYLQAAWRKHLEGKQYGTAINYVRMGNFTSFQIPLAPLPEQERIVAKIEELFTQLDAGSAALKRVRAGLKRYKASVLKAAVEGRLFDVGAQGLRPSFGGESDGREGRTPGKAAPTNGGLPDGWLWVTVEQVCERIVDCLHSTPKFSENGHYCVDSTWIKPGVFVFEKARFVDDAIYIERNRRMAPQTNDVVFSREGALLGVAVRVPENFEFCLGQRMMIFRPEKFLDSKFLEFFLNSQVFRSQFAPLITGTASPHLNIGDIRTFLIPLPPLAEQRRIVAEVERRLSVAAQVESALAASVARAAMLRQSVLKSAFDGRLG